MSNIEHGTVLRGTLLPYDLIEAFTSELEDLSVGEDQQSIKDLISEGNDVCTQDRDFVNYDLEGVDDLIFALADKINELVPEGTYFGAHPGDGADFGYWPWED